MELNQQVILVVADDSLNRTILAANLEENGYAVLEAENGLDGLKIMKAQPVDLVMLDLVMPELDGLEILKRIVGDQDLRDIPVMMTSGDTEQDSIARCIQAGAVDYLTKPFDPVILNARVKNVLHVTRQTQYRKKGIAAAILVVDDDALYRTLLTAGLDEKGYHVAEAENGREAYQMLRSHSFDLVFLDLLMPEMNGFELLELMKADTVLFHIPVIVISAESDMDSIVRCIETGAADYLSKPFEPVILHARVNSSLAAKRMHDQEREYLKTIEEQRSIAEAANKKIMDSIRYAERIQRSLLPNPEEVNSLLPHSFFLWKPRDIVGGDIFYVDALDSGSASTSTVNGGFILAVIDCTGHGVPGAFMTMIAVSGLRKIIHDEKCQDPAEILKRLNLFVKQTLQQDKEYAVSDDGMDIGIVRFQAPRLIFAGAKLPLYCVHQKTVSVIKADKISLGYKRSDLDFTFRNHEITVTSDMQFYLATDGFTDQLSGSDQTKFGTRRFIHLLADISHLPFGTQHERLEQEFENHQGNYIRLDDLTVVGFETGIIMTQP